MKASDWKQYPEEDRKEKPPRSGLVQWIPFSPSGIHIPSPTIVVSKSVNSKSAGSKSVGSTVPARDVPARKCAIVYVWRGAMYIGPQSSQFDNMMWVVIPPFSRVPLDAPPVEKIQAIMNALDNSKQDVDLGDKSHDQEFLKFIGAKSWAAIHKEALCIGIEMEGEKIEATPFRSAGRGRFQGDSKKSLSGSTKAPPEDNDKLLRKVMRRCK